MKLNELFFRVVTVTPERNKKLQQALFDASVVWGADEKMDILDDANVICVEDGKMWHIAPENIDDTSTNLPFKGVDEAIRMANQVAKANKSKVKFEYDLLDFDIDEKGAFQIDYDIYSWQNTSSVELGKRMIFGGWLWECNDNRFVSMRRQGIRKDTNKLTSNPVKWMMPAIPVSILFWKKK